jgi:Cytochrome c, mono- and diheme variants
MRFISKYRKHKLAKPFLLLFSLCALGFTFSIATAAPASNSMAADARSTLIEEGQQIFLKGCSSCHGLNGEGAGAGPALIGVGAASVDFQVGTGRMPMQDMSQQAMRKAPVYDEEQTAALAAYVASLAPGPRAYSNEEIKWERDGNTAEGGELFRNNCAMCHNFAGQGGALTQGKYAPTVMGVEPKHIYEALLTGRKRCRFSLIKLLLQRKTFYH